MILPSPDAPPWSRWLLSLLLPMIAMALYWEGQDYDPGLIALRPAVQGTSLPEQLVGLPRFGPLRAYDKDNLYEYINGHAEYYLGTGFKALTVAEYASAGSAQPELVVNLYQMGEPLFAFAVLMNELSPDATPVEGIGALAFANGNGFNLIHGPYYLQISRFTGQADPRAAGRALVQALHQGQGELAQLDLSFPALGEPLATQFVKEDYRGLGFLRQVLERRFRRDGKEFAAFQINGPPHQIEHTTQALLTFLGREGIPVEHLAFQGLNYHLVDDPYEGQWFFIQKESRLLGAFSSPNADLLQAILSEMKGQRQSR